MWLEFGIINYKLIIPFIYPFFYQVRRLIHNSDKKPFYEFFTNYCGYLFSGLVYFIIISRMKKLNSSNFNEKKTETLLELKEVGTIKSLKSQNSSTKEINTIKLCNTIRFENQINLELIKRNKRSRYN